MPQVDYAALAKQARSAAPVDYAALAKQARTAPAPAADRPRDWSEKLGLHEPTSSPALGFVRGAGTAAVDLAEGITSGAAKTIYGGGDLIRRGLGMERVIDTPAAQQAMRAPDTFTGKAGQVLEQGAEFAIPLSRVSKAVAGSRLLTRAAAEGAASAGVAGVQSGGDTGAMTVAGAGGAILPFAAKGAGAIARTVQRAAAGAKDGGMGGAVASAVRTVAPGEPRTLMVQALKPRSVKTNFPGALDRALPEIKAAERAIGKPIANITDLLNATKAAKGTIQTQLNQMRGAQRAISAEVDLSSVADEMVKAIPRKVQLLDKGKADTLKAAANVYRQKFSLDDAEALLRDTNAELDSFYDMYPAAQRSKLATNPAVASLNAQATALRDAIYKKLDDPGQGAAARELNRRWGSINEIEREATRRANVAARQQPESLSEQIGNVRAAADVARGTWRLLHFDPAGAADIAAGYAGRSTAKYLKEQQTTDALIKRAFQGYKGRSTPVVMPAKRPVRGLLPRGPIVTPPPADPSFVRGVRGEYGR